MATLQIDLDDEATHGVMALNDQLDQTAQATNALISPTTALTKVQTQQLVVIERQRTMWADVGVEGVRALNSITLAGIHCFEEIETAVPRAVLAISTTVIKETGSVLRFIYGARTAIRGLGLVFGRTAQDAEESSRSFIKWGSLAEYAGKQAVLSMTGLGPYVTGATLGWKAYEVVLARTGARTVELADGTKVVQTNLDRTNEAFGRLSDTMGRNVAGAQQAISDWWHTPFEWPQIIKDVGTEIDAAVTRSNDRMVANINHLTDAIAFVPVATAEASAKIQSAQARNAEGYALLRSANDQLRYREEDRAEAAHIASIKNVADIDKEVYALKEWAGQRAAAGQFDEATQKGYAAAMEARANRRAAIEKEEADRRAKFHADQKTRYSDEMKALDDVIKKQLELFNLGREQKAKLQGLQDDLGLNVNKQNRETAVDAAQGQHAIDVQRVTAAMKARGDDEVAIKRQVAQMDKQLSELVHQSKVEEIDEEAKLRIRRLQEEHDKIVANMNEGADKDKALLRNRMDAEKELADRRKKLIDENGRFAREQNKIELDAKKAAEEAKFKIEADRINKIRQLQEDAVKKVDVKGLLQGADPEKVLRQIQASRADAARQAQAQKDSDLFNRGQDGDKSAMRKFEANQRAAAAKASRGAMNDFENGNLQEGEVQKAQAKVTEQMLNNGQAQGKVNSDVVKMMTDALKTQVDQQTALDNVQQVLLQLMNAQKGIKQTSKQQAGNFQAQIGALL